MIPSLLRPIAHTLTQTPLLSQSQRGLYRVLSTMQTRHQSNTPPSAQAPTGVSQWIGEHADRIRTLGALTGIGSVVSGIIYAIATAASAANIRPLAERIEAEIKTNQTETNRRFDESNRETNRRFDEMNGRLDNIYHMMYELVKERHGANRDSSSISSSPIPSSNTKGKD